MELADSQKSAVAQWFAAGASLDEIQKRIKSEFGVHMTYLDLRLMVAELPQPDEGGPEEAVQEAQTAESAGEAADQDAQDEAGDPGEAAEDGAVPQDQEAQKADVSVDLDAITIPGTMASGGVVFSDGTKGKWYLDGYGRLGLDAGPGYRPPPADAALFQARLMELLRSRGII